MGTRLVGPDGRPLALRGVNLGGWLLWEGWEWGARMSAFHLATESQSAIGDGLSRIVGPERACAFQRQVYRRFVTEADVAAIAALGLNVVRVPVNYRALDCPEAPGWARLDALVRWCARHQVYVVLDLHAAPGGQSGLFPADPTGPKRLWASKAAQDRTVALWRTLAARYATSPTVAGYDLLNEPDPPSGEALVALYRRIVAGIRSVDPNHLVILEGSGFATDFSMFQAPLDPNEAYSFHSYSWLADRRDADLARYRRVAEAQGVPFWCGEFGQNTYAMIAGTLERFTARTGWLAGWAMWTWKQVPGKYPALNAIHPPAAFVALMSHLVDGDGVDGDGRTPEAAGAWRALGGFLDAAAYDRTVHDRQLGEILSHYAAAPPGAATHIAAAPPVEAPPRSPPAAGVRSRRAGGGSR